jgi:hypothetical protein
MQISSTPHYEYYDANKGLHLLCFSIHSLASFWASANEDTSPSAPDSWQSPQAVQLISLPFAQTSLKEDHWIQGTALHSML